MPHCHGLKRTLSGPDDPHCGRWPMPRAATPKCGPLPRLRTSAARLLPPTSLGPRSARARNGPTAPLPPALPLLTVAALGRRARGTRARPRPAPVGPPDTPLSPRFHSRGVSATSGRWGGLSKG
ncbi:hypothetical protein NDU88_005542 [Pleurodeles waltl]|uniref:Uncharacterized protein n=1 Tax=Pleurodeles waltl TaxID=8319 RepID=A0AAV7PH48_PLEWA|nr:hypothetical protein NDU88_005542 [Pleurodeles waltl]